MVIRFVDLDFAEKCLLIFRLTPHREKFIWISVFNRKCNCIK